MKCWVGSKIQQQVAALRSPHPKKILGAPFKPSFGLSGVVADPDPPRCVIRTRDLRFVSVMSSLPAVSSGCATPACLRFVTGLSFICHSASHPLPGERKTEEN